MKSLVTTCLLLLFARTARAQDFQYSQFYASSQLLNPAATGFMGTGAHRFAAMYRGQWDMAASTRAYQGAAAAYDFRSCTNRGYFWSGGVHVQTDWSAFAAVRNTAAIVSAAFHQQLGGTLYGAAGFSAGALNYGFDPGALQFDAQYDGIGFDASRANGEVFQSLQRTVPDLGAGIQLYDTRAGWSGGLALLHVNQPRYAFLDQDNRLGVSLTAYGAWPVNLRRSGTRQLLLRALYRRQTLSGATSRQWQLTGGAMYRLTVSSDRFIAAGLLMRVANRYRGVTADAVIPVLQTKLDNWLVGLSYDGNLTRLRDRPPGGLELSLTTAFGDDKTCVSCPGW